MPSPAGGRDINDARERATQYFAPRQSRAGYVARRLLGTPSDRDAVLADLLVREARQRTRMDGSMDGSLVRTAWLLLELVQLDCPPDHAGVVRVVGWLLRRQNQPGRFGETCDENLHHRGLCHHFLTGFFSPGDSAEALAPLTFPTGVVVHDEADARFAGSCFALRAVLRARQERRQVVMEHVTSLLNLGEMWSSWGAPWPGDVVLFALAALAHAPLDHRERVEKLATQVARRQRPSGEWEGADLIHAVDTMLSIPSAAARAAVRAALPPICAAARAGELFSDTSSEERSLIALRALMIEGG